MLHKYTSLDNHWPIVVYIRSAYPFAGMEVTQLPGSLNIHNPSVSASSSKGKRSDISTFVQQYISDNSVKPDDISLDHCYSKDWNSQSVLSHARTAKYISWSNNGNRKVSR